MTLSVKRGAIIEELHPAMVTALPTIMQTFARHGLKTTITEGNDTIGRKHKSYHKTIPLRALDFRTWADATGLQLNDGVKAALAIDLRAELGSDFDVTYGPMNLHVEYDPDGH